LAVALGATCTLDMTDSFGDGWNGAEWSAPGFRQTFSLAESSEFIGGNQGSESFVVEFQPPSPPSPPMTPPSPPSSPPYVFTTKASLQTAVQEYKTDPTGAIATYGRIANWDVSAITDMSSLFSEDRDGGYNYDDNGNPLLDIFNDDISSWDTSGVTTMVGMFQVRSAKKSLLSRAFPAASHLRGRPPRLPARTSLRISSVPRVSL
jgi:hypothetical protein